VFHFVLGKFSYVYFVLKFDKKKKRLINDDEFIDAPVLVGVVGKAALDDGNSSLFQLFHGDKQGIGFALEFHHNWRASLP
jgi:hypothetical protein